MIDFFKGIKIVNGENGINIIKNVAMEAYVELASKADVKVALKLDSKRVDDRVIHGKFCIIKWFMYFNVSAAFIMDSHFFLVIQNSFWSGTQRNRKHQRQMRKDKSK